MDLLPIQLSMFQPALESLPLKLKRNNDRSNNILFSTRCIALSGKGP
jgi:hypothetical protein